MANKRLRDAAVMAFCFGSCGLSVAHADPPVVLGGTCTMQDLLTASNTDDFRSAGGGLYIHYNGWIDTLSTAAQRKSVWSEFQPEGAANAELGFSTPPGAWTSAFQTNFVNNGVTVGTISVNGLSTGAGESTATVAQAETYIDAFKSMGQKTVTPVFSPNFDATTAAAYPFSDTMWNNVRTVATYGGGWTSDAPPAYFFGRDQGYRDWVIAETQWVNANGLKSINIISPHTSGTNFFTDAVNYVNYFEAHDAIPKEWVVENYSSIGDPPAGYVNQIGSEDNVNNLAYTADWLIHHVQGRANTLDLWSSRKVGSYYSNVGHNAFSTAPADNQVTLPSDNTARTWTINLSNLGTDATTDFYAPELSAVVSGDTSHWQYSFTFNGADVTAALLSGGFTLDGANLLNAASTETFTLNVQRLAGAGAPFELDLFAKANPDATVTADALSFAYAVPEPASLGAIAIGASLLLRRRKSYGLS